MLGFAQMFDRRIQRLQQRQAVRCRDGLQLGNSLLSFNGRWLSNNEQHSQAQHLGTPVGSRGIGESCARIFAAEGCNLALAATDAVKLKEVAGDIVKTHGVKVTTHALDLTKQDNLKALDNPALKKDLKVFWTGIGKNDSLAMPANDAMLKVLKDHGFKVDSHTTAGAHDWVNWQNYLNEFTPLLFK